MVGCSAEGFGYSISPELSASSFILARAKSLKSNSLVEKIAAPLVMPASFCHFAGKELASAEGGDRLYDGTIVGESVKCLNAKPVFVFIHMHKADCSKGDTSARVK